MTGGGLSEALNREATEAWHLFLLLPNTPSPLGDRLQTLSARLRDLAACADATQQAGEAVQRYVVGFALDHHGRVALIRKNRPAWQAGRLNGIGGHVEPGEVDDQAMRREFREETGADVAGWEPFVVMDFPDATITFYRARVGDAVLDGLRSTTDEPVSLHSVTDATILGFAGVAIPNLSWLVPLASYAADDYEPIHVRAAMAAALAAPAREADPQPEDTTGGAT